MTRICQSVSLFLMVLGAGAAHAAVPPVVDFESIPSDSPPWEGAAITDQYWFTNGVRFSSEGPGRLVLAQRGAPQKAFLGFDGQPDTPMPGASVGEFFLTEDRGGAMGVPGPFVVEYRYPVQIASGVFMDVNANENWTATAYDSTGAIRGTAQVWPGVMLGSAYGWSIDVHAPVITKVRITFTGQVPAGGVTFAFDNFRGSRPECAADLTGDSLVDFSDYLAFLNEFSEGSPIADFTGDGTVDFSDYLEFLNEFDEGC